MEKVDGVLLKVTPLVVVPNDHPYVFMPGHALYLAIGESQAQRPRDGRPPQVVGREGLFGFIQPGKAGPAIDDLANVPGRERPGEFQRAVVDGRLKDERVVAVAVEIPPALGVQLQVVINGLLNVLGEGDCPLAASFDLNSRRPAPVAPDERGDAQVPDLADAQAGPRQRQHQRVIPRAFGLAPVRRVEQTDDFLGREGASGHVIGRGRHADEFGVGRIDLDFPRRLQIAEVSAHHRELRVDGPSLPAFLLHQVVPVGDDVLDRHLCRGPSDEGEEIEQRAGVGPAGVFRDGLLDEVPGLRQFEADRPRERLIGRGRRGGRRDDHRDLSGHRTLSGN